MKKSMIAAVLLFLFAGIAFGQGKTDVEKNKKVATIYHDLKVENIDNILTEDFIGRSEKDRHTWTRENHHKYLGNGQYKKDHIFHQIAEGNWVATRFFREMDYQGKRIKVEMMHFKRFEDGKIAEIWEYGDRKQVDTPPAPKTTKSPEKSLDQAELIKQFVGTWKAETGEDSTAVWKISPSDKGYESVWHSKAKGETYATSKGIIGFTWENEKVNMFHMMPNGMMLRDLGGFISEKKLVFERFSADHSTVFAKWELNFQSPDKIYELFKWRENAEKSWDDAHIVEFHFTRVN